MRRSALFVVGCALSLFIGVAPAAADNGPHMKGAGPVADTCAACHRAHTAQGEYLLKSPEETLCFTCHGSGGTGANNDVVDGVGYSGSNRSGGKAGALRGGGFEFALIDSASPTATYDPVTGRLVSANIPVRADLAPVTSTHSTNSSAQTAWGNGAISATANYGKTIPLNCANCHDPHGNGNYRILRDIPEESGATTGVTIADTDTKVYTTDNYWQTWDTNAPQFRYQVAQWCTTCHTRYLAGSKSYKTNSGDAVFTYRHRSEYAQADYESSPTKARPNCIQCHVSHGSNATMGERSSSVAFPDGSAGPSGDSRLLRVNNRGTCQVCHHK
jgi:predicted CXXCH cytochrome family protein